MKLVSNWRKRTWSERDHITPERVTFCDTRTKMYKNKKGHKWERMVKLKKKTPSKRDRASLEMVTFWTMKNDNDKQEQKMAQKRYCWLFREPIVFDGLSFNPCNLLVRLSTITTLRRSILRSKKLPEEPLIVPHQMHKSLLPQPITNLNR